MKKQSFICAKLLSLPVREVWIEIVTRAFNMSISESLPVREVWIEIKRYVNQKSATQSLPVREVWIEMEDDIELSIVHFCHFP